jgi:hypothetical protein
MTVLLSLIRWTVLSCALVLIAASFAAAQTPLPRVMPTPTPLNQDRFGAASAACDFNGDGHDDLVVGAPSEDDGGKVDVGVINIIYSKSTGGLDAAGNHILKQNFAQIADVPEAYDRFGSALAAGYFNNDPYCDLAVGIPGESPGNSSITSGAVGVIYGSSVGLNSLLKDDQLWHFDSIIGAGAPKQHADGLGSSLVAGDFNRDNIDDLAIGAPHRATASGVNAGAVVVLYGSETGLQRTSPPYQIWDQDSTGVPGTAESSDSFGYALAAADFNMDSYVDLAVGVPGETLNSLTSAGYVNVLHGAATGLVATSTAFSQQTTGVPNTSQAHDRFGHALAAADFDNDGAYDLAVGVPGERLSGETGTSTGLVHIFYGKANVGLSVDRTQVRQYAGPTPAPGERAPRFGERLVAGDFHDAENSGDDLVIGVPWASDASVNAGALVIFYGAAGTGLSTGSIVGHQNLLGETAEKGDFEFGSLAVGRFDGNHHDLVWGLAGEDFQSPIRLDAGLVHVVHGGPGGLTATGAQIWHQDSPDIAETAD